MYVSGNEDLEGTHTGGEAKVFVLLQSHLSSPSSHAIAISSHILDFCLFHKFISYSISWTIGSQLLINLGPSSLSEYL